MTEWLIFSLNPSKHEDEERPISGVYVSFWRAGQKQKVFICDADHLSRIPSVNSDRKLRPAD